MSTITLDYGGANLSYECQRAGHADPRRAGSKLTSFAQRLTSSVRREFMVVPLVLQPLTASQAAAVRALFALGAQVPCRGDAFNNGNATVVCSGKITDELDQTNTWWTLTLTLYEVGTNAGYTPPVITLYLTHVASGGGYLCSTDAADDPSGVFGNQFLMDPPEVIPTCGNPLFPNPAVSCTVGTSAGAEVVWESPPSPNGGTMVGAPYFFINSRGGTADCWSTQHVRMDVFLVRSGVDVLEFDTDYSTGNGGFSGGAITGAAPAIVWTVQVGDTLRVEAVAQAGLHSGYASDADYQRITFGNLGGAAHLAGIVYRGTALFQ